MAQGSQQSFKDEWLVALFSIPLILSFCGEWGRTIVAEGFAALETMPDWYQYTLGVIVAASLGCDQPLNSSVTKNNCENA